MSGLPLALDAGTPEAFRASCLRAADEFDRLAEIWPHVGNYSCLAALCRYGAANAEAVLELIERRRSREH